MLVNISRRSVFNELCDNVRAWKFRAKNAETIYVDRRDNIDRWRDRRERQTTTIIYDDDERIIIITITGTWSE